MIRNGATTFLAIDVGNTETKLALISKETGEIKERWLLGADFSGDVFKLMFFLRKFSKLDAVALSSVVPRVGEELELHLRRFYQVWRVSQQWEIGYGVDSGTVLGEDLVALALGAAEKKKKLKDGVIVVSMGTATTISLLSPQLVLEGCLILPGLGIQLSSLLQQTALVEASNLSWENLGKEKIMVGKNTVMAVTQGIGEGHLAAVDKIVSGVKQSVDYECELFLTGDYSEFFKRKINGLKYDPDLLLTGLWRGWRNDNMNGR